MLHLINLQFGLSGHRTALLHRHCHMTLRLCRFVKITKLLALHSQMQQNCIKFNRSHSMYSLDQNLINHNSRAIEPLPNIAQVSKYYSVRWYISFSVLSCRLLISSQLRYRSGQNHKWCRFYHKFIQVMSFATQVLAHLMTSPGLSLRLGLEELQLQRCTKALVVLRLIQVRQCQTRRDKYC